MRTDVSNWLTACAIAAVPGLLHARQSESPPARGAWALQASTRVAPGTYERTPTPAHEGEPACLIRIERRTGLVLDLGGAHLRGAAPDTPQDRLDGYAIYLTDCRDVVVRGGTLSGVRGGIVAERCDGLRIENVRFDGNFAQRLRSTLAAEDEGDWLRPHDNDHGEWLAHYGAAISLTNCESPVVSGCRVRHGQNGILLTRSNNARIFDNDASFLSGWGIALYRSSGNLIARNRCDYCVRGYSHERYWRGQDSAGILLFERCSNNLIAENSAVCGGDGLFLYAGEDLVEGHARARGEADPGGSDRNLIYRNDFSFAVANGIETTFSRDNRAIENRASGCRQHGLWAGYSSRMLVARNDFRDAGGAGISIEHGQECALVGNLLERCAIGLELYWDEDPHYVSGPFGRFGDSSSRDHLVLDNSFAENDVDIAIERSTGLAFGNNIIAAEQSELSIRDLVLAEGLASGELEPKEHLRGVLGRLPSGRIQSSSVRPALSELPAEWAGKLEVELNALPGSTRPFDPARRHPGLESIHMGQWGPWDFESGEPRPELRPVGGLFAAASWRARWFSWSAGPDPRGNAEAQAQWRALAEDAAVELDVRTWLDPWADERDVHAAVGDERFGLLAATSLELEAGRYRLRVESDDGVRVRVDGTPRLEDWSWHPLTRSEVLLELPSGRHTFEVEYFQIDGAAALTLDLLRL